jgi:hypothetical protein
MTCDANAVERLANNQQTQDELRERGLAIQ